MKTNRRTFFKTTGVLGCGIAMLGPSLLSACKNETVKNPIPKWRGFNLLDYFNANKPTNGSSRNATTENDFRWMRDWGFDFVRLPMAYPRYITFDPSRPITPDETYNIDWKVVDEIRALTEMAHKYNLHMSLNLHRAPGYCVNAGFHEPFNLWKDQEALDAFLFHWETWAKVFKDIPDKKISFDLVNEPSMREDMNDQHSRHLTIPGNVYRKVAKAAAEKIRSVNPQHMVIADGNNVGNSVIPEITDLNIAQSCRGYFPHYISHHKAPWAMKEPDKAPKPVWPGVMDGEFFGRKGLEEYYQPWIDLTKQGVGVHCGECGCWKKTPHNVFLAWFEDVIDILTSNGIGYALWNFRGDFGILDSGREDVNYEDWHGHKLDRKLLNLLKRY
ncbi:MAG: cellulase family glycosylhydrolase [Prolixibacteraceae bacterium]|nr:cellulase family glycosylhydrolase [Prolixibacteraceae bacterium]